jgi:galactose mutarotase-like enzyme
MTKEKMQQGTTIFMAALCLMGVASLSRTAAAGERLINGQPVIVLKRDVSKDAKGPEFLTATILPGRGMNLLQVTAFIPGRGVVDVLATPSLDEVAKQLDGDEFGNKSFSTFGGAYLVPYANRIRGTLSADGRSLVAEWQGRKVTLPANWSGRNPGAERHSIHGLILTRKADDLKLSTDGTVVTATIHAGDFEGRWFSSTDLTIRIALHAESIVSTVIAKNVGKASEPMGIGWHPYFAIPSGDRAHARLHIPATQHVEANNLDDVFPTGKITAVQGTRYDFTAPEGSVFGSELYDESFCGLTRKDGQVVVDLIDPKAGYGLSIRGLSPEIKTVQFYAPKDKPFVALEEQFNFGDPFGKEWEGKDSGMVTLKPGEATTWRVNLHLFVP